MKEEYILKLVQIQNQFRFLHWQTTFDAKHKAYGGMYEGIANVKALLFSISYSSATSD